MRTRVIQAAVAATLLCGAVAYAADSGLLGSATPPKDSATPRQPARQITVAGRAIRLYPGAHRRVFMRVRNSYPFNVTVTSVGVKVLDASPTCKRRVLRVRRFAGAVPIRAHGAVKVRAQIRMRPGAPDSCQGARFPLRFKARVKR